MVIRSLFILLFSLLSLFMVPSCDNEAGKTKTSQPVEFDFFIDWSPGPDYIGFYVSDEKGYYSKEGISINIRSGNGAETAATLLKSGAIKIGTTTVDALVRQEFKQREQIVRQGSSQKGVRSPEPPKIVAIVFVTNPVVILTRKDLPVHKLENLAGMKIGYSEQTSVTFTQFTILLDTHPSLKKAIKLVKVGWNGPQEFQAGHIDGLLAYATDVPPELKMQGIPFNMRRLADFGMTVPGQCIAISSKCRDQLSANVLNRFLRASIKGWEFARANPEKSADLFVAKFPGQNKKKTSESIKYTVELLPPVFGDQYLAAYTSVRDLKSQVKSAINVLSTVIDVNMLNINISNMADRMIYIRKGKQ